MLKDSLVSGNQSSTSAILNIELADLRNQLAAVHKFQSIAEFTMDGNVISANENYLKLTGYPLNELAGQHISMLLDIKYRNSAKNAFFWETLNNGECISGKFKRIAKGGRIVWIQAYYYPMLDLDNKPFKVVEYASDVTEQVQLTQALTDTVEQAQEVVQAIKKGNLAKQITLDGKTGEIASLCNNVNYLAESLAAVVMLAKCAGNSNTA